MRIESNRCQLREFEMRDIDDFIKYRNDVEWMAYQGFKGLSREEYIDALLKEFDIEKGAQLAVVEKSSDQLLGDIYLQKDKLEFWIGYTIAPEYSRRGYASEVACELIKWIMKTMSDVDTLEYKICAGVHPENIASIKLIEKLGLLYKHQDNLGDYIYEMVINN